MDKTAGKNLIVVIIISILVTSSTIVYLTNIQSTNKTNTETIPTWYSKLAEFAKKDGKKYLKRLKQENMPTHAEIQEFARQIAELTGYHYTDEREESRVVLLVKKDPEIKQKILEWKDCKNKQQLINFLNS